MSELISASINVEFLVTSVIIVLLPGTGVLYTLSTGLVNGARASLFAAIGCTLGIIPHLLASVMGLTAVMHTSSLAFQLLKYLGVAYLFYIAWMMWKESGVIEINNEIKEKKLIRISIRGFLINILNPKLSIFFLAFLPQFVPATTHTPISYLLVLSAVFMLMTLLVFICYGLFAHAIRNYISQSPTLIQAIQRAFAGIFLVLGYKLATVDK